MQTRCLMLPNGEVPSVLRHRPQPSTAHESGVGGSARWRSEQMAPGRMGSGRMVLGLKWGETMLRNS